MGKMKHRGVATGDTSDHQHTAGGTPGKTTRTGDLPAHKAAKGDEPTADKGDDELSSGQTVADVAGESTDDTDDLPVTWLDQKIIVELMMMLDRFASALKDVQLDEILEMLEDQEIMNAVLDLFFLGLGVAFKGPVVHALKKLQVFKNVSHELLDSAFEGFWENNRFRLHHAKKSSNGRLAELRQILDALEVHAQDVVRAAVDRVAFMTRAQKKAFLDTIRDESITGKDVFVEKIREMLEDLKAVARRMGDLGRVRPIYGGIELGVLKYVIVHKVRYMVNLRSFSAGEPGSAAGASGLGLNGAPEGTTHETLQFDILVPGQFQKAMHDRYAEVRGPQPMGEVMDFDHGYPRPPWFDQMYQVVKGIRSRGEIARYATPATARPQDGLSDDDMFAKILPRTRPNDEGDL